MAGDIVLLSLRDFQDNRADVIHKYTADEARNLKTYGELKSDFQIHEAAQGAGEEGSDDEEGGVEFEEADIDDICECAMIRLSCPGRLALWVSGCMRRGVCVGGLVLPLVCRLADDDQNWMRFNKSLLRPHEPSHVVSASLSRI